jgi:hypothetical protein
MIDEVAIVVITGRDGGRQHQSHIKPTQRNSLGHHWPHLIWWDHSVLEYSVRTILLYYLVILSILYVHVLLEVSSVIFFSIGTGTSRYVLLLLVLAEGIGSYECGLSVF